MNAYLGTTLLVLLIAPPQSAPYPPSAAIAEIRWAPVNDIVRHARGSDNWPLTWSDDDNLFTAYGDGWGFSPRAPRKLSMGFSTITGMPGDFRGHNVRSASGEDVGDGAKGRKASGLLMVDGVLYVLVRNVANSQLGWSTDRGNTWTWSDWKFTTSFGYPTFLNFGKNYAGARDDFVYIYSSDADSAYAAADRMVLARVDRRQLSNRSAYQFFVGTDGGGKPIWTGDLDRRGAVFSHPRQCYRGGITFNAGLQRYMWCQIHPDSKDDRGPRFQGGFGIYDAPEPWGPWTTVYFTPSWDVGPGETASFPTKWMSQDGRTVHLVFSGDDCFSVRKATLSTH